MSTWNAVTQICILTSWTVWCMFLGVLWDWSYTILWKYLFFVVEISVLPSCAVWLPIFAVYVGVTVPQLTLYRDNWMEVLVHASYAESTSLVIVKCKRVLCATNEEIHSNNHVKHENSFSCPPFLFWLKFVLTFLLISLAFSSNEHEQKWTSMNVWLYGSKMWIHQPSTELATFW